jgi:hypothetical protein
VNLYVLELLFAGVHVRVAVNGIEILSDDSAASKTIGSRINPYVIDGENTLAIALRLPPPPVSVADAAPPAAPEFKARLIRGVLGRDPGAAGVMLQHEWSPASDPLVPGSWKVVLNQAWTAPVSFGRWAWQDAPAAALGSADTGAILGEVSMLHAAALQRDGRTLLDAHRLKFAEMARAMGATEAEFNKDLADALLAMFAAPDYQVAPLDPARLLVEPLAGGRLVRVRLPDGRPPIQARGGEESLQLLPIFTRVGGRWVLAR